MEDLIQEKVRVCKNAEDCKWIKIKTNTSEITDEEYAAMQDLIKDDNKMMRGFNTTHSLTQDEFERVRDRLAILSLLKDVIAEVKATGKTSVTLEPIVGIDLARHVFDDSKFGNVEQIIEMLKVGDNSNERLRKWSDFADEAVSINHALEIEKKERQRIELNSIADMQTDYVESSAHILANISRKRLGIAPGNYSRMVPAVNFGFSRANGLIIFCIVMCIVLCIVIILAVVHAQPRQSCAVDRLPF